MYSVEFKLDYNDLRVNIEEVEKRTLIELKKAVKDTAEDIKKDAKKKVAYKTGALSRSINTTYGKQGSEAVIKADVSHASFVEYGTRAHTIRPKNKKALAFNSGNKMTFAKKVNHPGTKAKPFMEPAFNENVPLFIKRLEDALNGSNK